jgi:hypothetical protein
MPRSGKRGRISVLEDTGKDADGEEMLDEHLADDFGEVGVGGLTAELMSFSGNRLIGVLLRAQGSPMPGEEPCA